MRYNQVPWTFGLLRVRRATPRLLLLSEPALPLCIFGNDWSLYCFFLPSFLQPIIHAKPSKRQHLGMIKSSQFSSGLFHHAVNFTACWRALFTWRTSTGARAQHSNARSWQLRAQTPVEICKRWWWILPGNSHSFQSQLWWCWAHDLSRVSWWFVFLFRVKYHLSIIWKQSPLPKSYHWHNKSINKSDLRVNKSARTSHTINE